MSTETMNLLLVEDNPGDADLLRLALRKTDAAVYTLTHAEDLVSALQLLEATHFDVILLDLTLPDCHGLETLKRVQARVPDTPIVVLTGSDDATLGEKALQAGAEDYLVKGSVDGWLLTRAMRYSIERHRILTQLKEIDCLKSEFLVKMNQELIISGVREQELEEVAAVSQQELLQAQKMEGIGRLAGGIAHDFNNLLTAILGFTELAGETLAPDDKAQDYLLKIQKTSERAAMLTGQLLAFARKQIIAPRIVNLNNLIVDIDKLLRPLLGEDIELTLVLQPEAGQARIDPGQFGQVLMNLIVNARDAMPGGGKITLETAKVTLSETQAYQREKSAPGDYVLLSVRDTGNGIDEETRRHLFEPFFTTKAQGKGTGLGLATCYGIVKQSGGHIQVDSAPGKGTTFHIYLPRQQAQEEAALPVQPETVSSLSKASGTILLVEDEPMVREIGVQTLRRQGYTVFEAANGTEALGWINAYPGEVDLLMTDVVMPQMGGRELAERLLMTHPNVKVLYTSGYTDDAILNEGILEPGLAFLQKPFTPSALAKKVNEVLLRK